MAVITRTRFIAFAAVGAILTALAASLVIAVPGAYATTGVTDANTSTVVASPTTVDDNGVAVTTITVTLKDSSGTPVQGDPISMVQNGGSYLQPVNGLYSGANGEVVITAYDATAETVTYTASDDHAGVTLAQQPSVTFAPAVTNAGYSSAVANPTSVAADGIATSTITVTLDDQSSIPVQGDTVSLTPIGGNSVIVAPNGNSSSASGVVTFKVHDTMAQAVTYIAEDTTAGVTVTQEPTVTFTTAATNAGASSAVANPTSVAADGIATSTITVTLDDSSSVPVQGDTVTLTPVSGSSVVSVASGTSSASGVVDFMVHDATIQAVTYTAEDTTAGVTITQQPVVTFTPLVTNAGASSALANPTSVAAGVTTSTITVTLDDVNGVPVQGHTVTLTPAAGNSIVSAASGPSSASGVVAFTVHDAAAQVVTYTATDITSAVAVTQEPVVTFVVGGTPPPPNVPTAPAAPVGSTSSASGSSSTNIGTATATDDGVTASAPGLGALTVAVYSSNPASAPTFASNGDYFDVASSSGNSFSSMLITDCNIGTGNGFHWFNPVANANAGAWQSVLPVPTITAGPPVCMSIIISSNSIPTLAQLTGTVFGVSGTPTQTPTPTQSAGAGYWLVAADGGVFSFGSAAFYGSEGATHLNSPIVGMTAAPDGNGYWLVAADGGVFSFGSAAFYGSEGATHLNSPIVGMTAAPDGNGYWLVAADGGVFSFGSAAFYGSEGATHLNSPIVGMTAAPDGNGYWLVAADGGVFSFGSAAFYGSEGATHLNSPIVGMTAAPDGNGYWLVAADGGVFSFGSAAFYGSEGATHLNSPIVGMTAAPDGNGYWLVAADGGVFSFGSAAFYGSEGATHLNSPVVGMG